MRTDSLLVLAWSAGRRHLRVGRRRLARRLRPTLDPPVGKVIGLTSGERAIVVGEIVIRKILIDGRDSADVMYPSWDSSWTTTEVFGALTIAATSLEEALTDD